ncbi:MAG: (2Fe-2S) ferredoxin domain-containing protein [Lentimicrobium sp.]
MEQKVDIQICLGSSCFSRGNKRLVKVIEQYLTDNNLRHLVNYHGAHCFSSCEKGPLVHIDGKEYQELDEEKILAILNELFGHTSSNL